MMGDPEATPEAPLEPAQRSRGGRVRLGAVLAVAVAGGLGAWAVVESRDSDDPAAGPAGSTPTATTTTSVRAIAPVGLSAKGLRTLTASIPEPIYWAGPKPGYLYELTRTNTGKIFIRYLPTGTPVGTKRATYLIVATYPFRNALKALTDLPGDNEVKIPGGGVAIVDESHPESVHMAFPGVDRQIEIYDPSPARSLTVAKSGTVRPVTP